MTNTVSRFNATSSAGPKTTDALSAANPHRKGFSIQNQEAEKLYVKLGLSCSTSDYDYVIKAATGAADGTVDPLFVWGYVGAISVKNGAGTANGGSFTFTEFV